MQGWAENEGHACDIYPSGSAESHQEATPLQRSRGAELLLTNSEKCK